MYDECCNRDMLRMLRVTCVDLYSNIIRIHSLADYALNIRQTVCRVCACVCVMSIDPLFIVWTRPTEQTLSTRESEQTANDNQLGGHTSVPARGWRYSSVFMLYALHAGMPPRADMVVCAFLMEDCQNHFECQTHRMTTNICLSLSLWGGWWRFFCMCVLI